MNTEPKPIRTVPAPTLYTTTVYGYPVRPGTLRNTITGSRLG